MNGNALKTAVGVLIKELGGLDAAASCVRVGPTNLSEYQSRNRADRHIPVDVVLDLEAIAQKPIVTAALARALGYRLVRIEAPASADVVAPVMRVSRDAGELAAQLMAALADQTIDATESDALMAVAQRVRGAIDDFTAALHARPGA